MALVTNVNVSVSLNDGLNLNPSIGKSWTRTAASNVMIGQLQTIATGSWQAINLGLISTVDTILIVNTDPTNYIQIALDNAGAHIFCKLQPGQALPLPLDPSATLYAEAHTGACVIEVLAAST